MKTSVYGEREAMIAWAQARLEDQRFRDDAQAIGLARDGELIGVTVFDTFSTTGCFVSIATDRSPHWMTRSYIREVFAYPFIQCGFARISCVISEHNAESLRFTRHFGWTQEGTVRRAGPKGEDLILFGMLRDECRWLPKSLFPVSGQAVRRAV